MKDFLVLQTDFGLSDGAVSAMYGVAFTVEPTLRIQDLTHDIPPYDIWNASYRLLQTVPYWPAGTVFVSVVDPGVGSARRSIACKTREGHFIITPDNGSITHLKRYFGLEEVRQIDEVKSRLPHSEESHTFHGRDIYAYNGARLAAHQVSFEELGEKIEEESCVALEIRDPEYRDGLLRGSIDVLDIRFGSLWSNISLELLRQADIKKGDMLEVTILHGERKVYQNFMPFGRSFADVRIGEPLVYVNSLTNIGVAINQDSFSKMYHIGTGLDWILTLRKAPRLSD